jgi:hypothetical protein
MRYPLIVIWLSDFVFKIHEVVVLIMGEIFRNISPIKAARLPGHRGHSQAHMNPVRPFDQRQ